MIKRYILFIFIVCPLLFQAQDFSNDFVEQKQDSLKKKLFLKSIGNGYFPTKYFNFDLRYLIKYNHYEGVRTGLGGITNGAFSEKYRITGYSVYGFRDHRFKYSFGGGVRLAEKTSTWLNISYTDDLQETGSTNFLTDGRSFQFFEPRLLNIDLFHKHITKTISVEHEVTPKLLSETEFSISKIDPTYSYGYNLGSKVINNFDISTAKVALQWSPFNNNQSSKEELSEVVEGYPKFTLQYTKSFKDVFGSDFGFSKWDFRTIYQIGDKKDWLTEVVVVSGIANGNTPITHLYHAYPNNITKEKILQRFSVAGLNSFETMFFNEFFSDKFTTVQFKHFLKPFNISLRYKPQLVLITRFAIGDMKHPEKHQNISFGSLNKGYTESGFEINKLLFGFGLSFTYRYGGYHLPVFSDNVAFKFTFNVSL